MALLKDTIQRVTEATERMAAAAERLRARWAEIHTAAAAGALIPVGDPEAEARDRQAVAEWLVITEQQPGVSLISDEDRRSLEWLCDHTFVPPSAVGDA